MNITKTIGLCIALLLATAIVHATQYNNDTLLNNLLDSYDSSYNDGGFNVNLSGHKLIPQNGVWPSPAPTEAGANIFNITIGGPSSTGTYNVIAKLRVYNKNGTFIGGNTFTNASRTGSGIVKLNFDGNYNSCTDPYNLFDTDLNRTMKIDLSIYQNDLLHYQRMFTAFVPCETDPVTIVDLLYGGSRVGNLTGRDTNGDGKPNFIDANISFAFPEQRTYRVGIYLTDNKTNPAIAYAEKNVTITTATYYSNTYVSILFDTNKLKQFNLNNDRIFLKSYTIDGNAIYDPNEGIAIFNNRNKNKFTTSNFNFQEIYTTNYTFDTSQKLLNGKIKNLGLKIAAINASGTYIVTAILENKYGELVTTNKTKVSSWPTTIWFNGTKIYESNINGPYRIGTISVVKNSELVHDSNVAVSADMTHFNFTAPPLSDLKVNDTDLQSDGKDINITLSNLGMGDAAGITLSLFDNSANKIKEVMISNISAGNTYRYKFKGVNLSNAFVAIDFTNEIEEMNESNNIASLRVSGGTGIAPPSISSVQPNTVGIAISVGQTKQFNITANGTAYKWFLSNKSGMQLVSTTTSFTFTPTYYDEGIRTLKVNVTNTNGTASRAWQLNITPNTMAVFAYVYNQNAKVVNSTIRSMNANISFDGSAKTITKTNSTDELPIKINLTTDTIHTVSYNSDNFQPFVTKFYFDKKLFLCTEGQNCNIPAPNPTSCVWDKTTSWNCTVTTGTTTDYFRMYPNPKRVKINAYLAVN